MHDLVVVVVVVVAVLVLMVVDAAENWRMLSGSMQITLHLSGRICLGRLPKADKDWP